MTTIDEVRAFLASSTRPSGKCLGTIGNDMTGHFGSYPNAPYSARAAANSLIASGEFHTTACPGDPHFDFYNFVQGGVNYGHIDYHVPAQGLHYANSAHITVKLNARGTVGTYPSYGAARIGWSYRPAAGDTMPTVTVAAPAHAPAPAAPSGAAWATNPPTPAVQARIQVALKKRGRYTGPTDGIFGTNTWKGIQRTAANVGYTGPQDGIPGEQTCHFIQVYAAKFGGYKGPINSILGPNGWEGFTRGLEAGLR